jgi:hypothetical protein
MTTCERDRGVVSAGGVAMGRLEPRIHPSSLAPSRASRLLRATKLFFSRLLSITKAMGDVQKKLQELSDTYQTFQGGEEFSTLNRQLLMVGQSFRPQ